MNEGIRQMSIDNISNGNYTMRLKAAEPKRWWHKYLLIKRKFVDFGINFQVDTTQTRFNIVPDEDKHIIIKDILITEVKE